MSDPQGGSGLHVHLDGDGTWPDLRDTQVEQPTAIYLAAIASATVTGRAGVRIRFDRKTGGAMIGQLTLRELHGAVAAIVARHGEDWMKPVSANETVSRLEFTLGAVLKQLMEAKQRLGEPMVFDMRAADAAYEQFRAGNLPS